MFGKNDKPPGKKRRLPSGMFFFILLGLFFFLTMNSKTGTKEATVGFSYQLENLVNLDLINPDKSKKVALNDNLVTFSGQFRDEKSETGQQRYNFLSHLFERNKLGEKRLELTGQLDAEKSRVLAAADWYLHLMGIALPKGGWVVVSPHHDTPGHSSALILNQLSDKQVIGLKELKAANLSDTSTYGKLLAQVTRNFLSPTLGISSEQVKAKLRAIEGQLAMEMTQVAVGALEAKYAAITSQLEAIGVEIGQSKEGVRLGALRSVRAYSEEISALTALETQIAQNTAQLSRARAQIGDVVWYFNNQELSTTALEKTQPDVYNNWFITAKKEWDGFAQEKGLAFKAPDQPLNLVLEKKFKSEEPATNYFGFILTFLPAFFVMALLYFVFARQMKGGAGGAMNFGKSPAKLLTRDAMRVTFKDVAGINEAKEELQEVVDFLSDPSKFTRLGAQIPKGVLLIGPPGTGKTLIAKAVAGEAERPFFTISGSDFVEMFVGVGASRIRDLFEQAKRNAPCIVFIDEIDAVGRHRGGGVGGGHDEREQTLNQLLVEMDGFDTNEGVIIMAATNRPDVLDKALLRPGRFDRRVTVDLPDVKGRLEILKVHAQRIKIDGGVDLDAIARGTPGCSGADLRNLLNEAALTAARKGRSSVTSQDATEATDKIRFGSARPSLEIDEEDRKRTAYHEAGHAVVGLVASHADPVEKVTIIPRGMSLGATHFLPKKNRLNYWKQELIDQIAVCMGGRIAEELFVGDISSGAQQDIIQATHIARSMVCQWGMSELGAIAYGEKSDSGQYLGLSSMTEKNYSDTTADKIDEEVKKYVDAGEKRAREICEEKRAEIELMTERLMQFETLYAGDLERIMTTGELPEEEVRSRMAQEQDRFRKSPPPPPEEFGSDGPTPEPS